MGIHQLAPIVCVDGQNRQIIKTNSKKQNQNARRPPGVFLLVPLLRGVTEGRGVGFRPSAQARFGEGGQRS